jgi:hypothetical protein
VADLLEVPESPPVHLERLDRVLALHKMGQAPFKTVKLVGGI